MKYLSLLLLLAAVLNGCSVHHEQRTSGTRYLSDFQPRTSSIDFDNSMQGLLRRAAAVEATLTLPARIGLARISGNSLKPITVEELDLWRAPTDNNIHQVDIVPIAPLVAEAVTRELSSTTTKDGRDALSSAMTQIRLASARQHVDAVLIYTTDTASQRRRNLLSVADLVLVGGAFVPSRSIKTEATAQALLMDVRSGYPYGSASASANLSKLSPWWGARGREKHTIQTVTEHAVRRLIPEARIMVGKVIKSSQARNRKKR